MTTTAKLEFSGQELNEIAATAGVAPLVVVPGQNFDAAIADDFGVLGVNDGGIRIALKVGGGQLFFGVAENALHRTVSSRFQRGVDGISCGRLIDENGEINNAD